MLNRSKNDLSATAQRGGLDPTQFGLLNPGCNRRRPPSSPWMLIPVISLAEGGAAAGGALAQIKVEGLIINEEMKSSTSLAHGIILAE